MENISIEVGNKIVTVNYVSLPNNKGTKAHIMRAEKITIDGEEVTTVSEIIRRKLAAAIHKRTGEIVGLVIPGIKNNTKIPPIKAERIDLDKKLRAGVTLKEVLDDRIPTGYI
jgi:hypothetical protein